MSWILRPGKIRYRIHCSSPIFHMQRNFMQYLTSSSLSSGQSKISKTCFSFQRIHPPHSKSSYFVIEISPSNIPHCWISNGLNTLSTIALVLESIPEVTRLQNFNVVAQIVEACVNVYFTIQALLLLVVYSSWRAYFKNALHWIDIASILPFYLRLAAGPYFSQVGL